MNPHAAYPPIAWHQSLAVRTVLCILGLLVLVLIAKFYYNLHRWDHHLEHDLENNASKIALVISKTIAHDIDDLDRTRIAERLQDIDDINYICGARVTHLSGELLADSHYPDTLNHYQYSLRKEIYSSRSLRASKLTKQVGWLELCIDSADIHQELIEARQFQLMFSIGMLVSVGVLSFVLLLIIFRPLGKVRAAMQNLKETMQPITDPALLKHNEIGELVASFNQMTADLTNAYHDLKAAKESAERANAIKSDFLANMTHELRTPLNSIIGMTNLTLEGDLQADQRKMLEISKQSAEMLLDLVNDVLDISKIEAGEVKLESVSFDMQACLQACVDRLKILAENKKLQLRIMINEPIPFLVGDPMRIQQVLSNLISNAIKYTDYGNVTVDLSYKPLGDGKLNLCCRVTDTGIGIPEHKIGAIFQKFRQSDHSDARVYGGTGLGLAIVAKLVNQMGGTVGVKSISGSGSTFWFELPMQVSTASVGVNLASHVDVDIKKLKPQEARLLVVEDNPYNIELIQRILRKYRFNEPDIAKTGPEAIEKIKQKTYDLVLLDCHLPELTGYDVARQIRSEETYSRAHLPIIAITANAMLDERMKCKEAGMDDYIAKPIALTDFVYVMSQWISFDASSMPSTQASSAKISPLVNLDLLRSYTDGDPETEQRMIALFIEQSELNMARLKSALESQDASEWVEAAHILKGAAASVGAEALQKLFEQAQLDGLKPDSVDRLRDITVAFQAVRQALEQTS